jgi:hypothetical protein
MPKIPNPFDKPRAGKKAYAYAVRKGPKAGVDTRPTEREPKRVAPRQRMPKELAPMPPRRGGRLKPRPMPMPRGPKGDGPKARPMPMPPKRGIRPMPKPMPKKPKRKP